MVNLRKKQNGFTLIELLVVISIIGLLSSMVMVALNNARIKARDAKRIADLNQLSKALEIYMDNHGSYPNVFPGGWTQAAAGTGCWANWQAGNAINGSSVQFLQPLVDDNIIKKTPLEGYWNASNNPCNYRYMSGIDFSPVCGAGWTNVAALYVVLERPRPTSAGAQPNCLSAWWYEAGTGDPNGYLILLRPQ